MRPVQFALAAVAAFVLLGSCSKDTTSPNPAVSSIHVTPGVDSVGTLGRTVTFAAQPVDAGGAPVSATVVWRSSNPAVATVDSVTGLATALTNGTTIISAHVGNVSGQATMAVSQVVAHVVISPPSAGFTAVGDTQRLTAVAKDSSGAIVQGVPFLWFSSDANVVTVDTAGLVKSKGPGSGFVTAAGRGVPGSAVITVTQTPMRLAFSAMPAGPIPVDLAFPAAIQVEVRDSNGQVATGSRIPITLSVAAQPGPGAVNGTLTVNAVAGIATFSGLTMGGTAGSYKISATTPGGVKPDTSSSFLVLPGKPVSLVLDVPPSSTPGIPFPVTVQGYDAYGNLATQSADTIKLKGSSGFQGALDRRQIALLTGGQADFDSVVVDGPGTFTITATDGALSESATTDAILTLSPNLFGGSSTACDLDINGHAFCWGFGVYGQLGGGREVSSTVPRLVARDLVFTQISAGYGHTCGIVAGGDAYCWGLNSAGQLGNGVPFGSAPESLPVLVVGGHKFTEIAVGYLHTCGLTSLSEILCWGDDSRGELGSGKTVASGLTGTPTAISSAFVWEHVTVSDGFFSSCGLTGSGIAYCWGANEYGQLGDNSLVDDSVPVAVVGTVKFSTIATGGTHTCAVTVTDSTAYCWGTGGLGRAGINMDSVAAKIDGGDHLHSLRSGADQSCGQLVTNEVECWNGTFQPAVDPRWGLPEVIVATGDFDCRSLSGTIGCLGDNAYGQLGNGTHAPAFSGFVDVLTEQPPAPAPRKR